MAQTKMVPVVIWTMPHNVLAKSGLNWKHQIVVPYNPEIGLVRYGGEAWWYELAKADIYSHTLGGAPKFNNFCEIQPRVYYGEPISYSDFMAWFMTLHSDSSLRKHYTKMYMESALGKGFKRPLVKLSKDAYVVLGPGEQVELVEFGTIEITHTGVQGNGPAGDSFYKPIPHDETGWSPDD